MQYELTRVNYIIIDLVYLWAVHKSKSGSMVIEPEVILRNAGVVSWAVTGGIHNNACLAHSAVRGPTNVVPPLTFLA